MRAWALSFSAEHACPNRPNPKHEMRDLRTLNEKHVCDAAPMLGSKGSVELGGDERSFA